MIEYLELDEIRTLFKIDDKVWQYYNTLKKSVLIPPEKHTILYLCPNIKEVVKCFNSLIEYYKEDCYISNNKSKIVEKNRNGNLIIFYNSAKDREELIYIIPLRKLKQGFEGYRISEIRFFGLNGCF